MTIDEMKQIKKEKGYSYAQIAELSGVPLGTVQKIFGGNTESPRYSTLQALEEFFLSETANDNNHNMVCEEVPYQAATEKKQGEYTVEDYYALPDDRRVELIDGVIYDMSSPTFVHQDILTEILSQIIKYIDSKKGNCKPLMSALDVRLDCDNKTIVQPDILIICEKNKNKIRRWGIMGAPDFALEVLSPSTRKKDMTLKLHKYANAGVREYWILDPDRQKLIVYDLEHEEFPVIYDLQGSAPVNIFDGELAINLDKIRELIQDYPEDGRE